MNPLRKENVRFLTDPANLVVLVFFAVFLGIGVLVFDDYGISWDELSQVQIGVKNYRYITQGDPALLDLRDRYYGPLFELFLVRVMIQSPSRLMYLSRHFWTFMAFYAGVVAFYFLVKRIFGNKLIAIFGCAILVAQPRIFADSFYNSKDIPFLAASIVCVYWLVRSLERPVWLNVLGLAITSAGAIGIRIAGVYLVALAICAFVIECIYGRWRMRAVVSVSVRYFVLTGMFCFAVYPVFWSDPFTRALEALAMMSGFPQYMPVLYLGQFISPQDLPWHYLPVWIGITTPLPVLILVIVGGGWGLWGLVRRTLHQIPVNLRRGLCIAGLWFMGPVVGVIALRSALYDSWRQMFFVYPALCIFACYGAWRLNGWVARRWGRVVGTWLCTAGAILVMVPAIGPMVQLHPYQNVFFNRFAGPDMQTIKQRFDLDYWGLAYREALEKILEIDGSNSIAVYADTEAGVRAAAILSTEDERRLHFVEDPSSARYFIGSYRWHPQAYPYPSQVFDVRVGNASLMSVFEMDEK